MNPTLSLLCLSLRAAEVAARKANDLPAAARNPNLDECLPHLPWAIGQLKDALEIALRGRVPDAATEDEFVARVEALVSPKKPRKG
jgi:hypothetical protein